MKTATIEFNSKSGKFEAIYAGQVIVKGGSHQYVENVITMGINQKAKKLGITKVSNVQFGPIPTEQEFNEPLPVDEFTIGERFAFVEEAAQMIIDGNIVSSILCGEGGLGKSYTIKKVLQNNGLKDIQKETQLVRPEKPEEDEDETNVEEWEAYNNFVPSVIGDYIFVKGYSTPKGLFRTLYENNGKIIIFDDCDSIQKHETAVNILKSALDSYDERMITWNSEMPFSDLPKCFLFTGKVIFISNWQLNQIAQPLRSRSIAIDLSMTSTQKIERMQYIINEGDFLPEISKEYQQDALDLIASIKDTIRELSLRSLITVSKIRAGDKLNWKKFAQYALQNN